MQLKKWLENWDMTGLKINLGFLETEWNPQTADKDAAWELYVELLTRITTQPLANEHGDEQTALNSIHSLFGITREVIKRHGRDCISFTKIAIIVLNQIVRPFTAKWHKLSCDNAFSDPDRCKEFRAELATLQAILIKYTQMLANMADVEDLTELEKQ